MNKKFELIKNDSIKMNDHKLYRIRALVDFNDVKAGDLGGYVESENNLSQIDDCWTYDNAYVFGNARVYNNARVSGNARVFGDAHVFSKAKIYGNAHVFENARVFNDACVYDIAYVFGSARIFDNACAYNSANVYGNAHVFENARVYGTAEICGNAEICENALITNNNDYLVFKNTWSSGRYFTYTRSNKMWKVGCFYGSGDELIQKAYEDSENSGKHYELYVNLVEEMEKLR